MYIQIMNSERVSEWPQFYTASVFQWKPLLKDDKFKDIIVNSLRFLVADNRIVLNAFVIMNTHIHLTCLPAGRFGNRKVIIHLQMFN